MRIQREVDLPRRQPRRAFAKEFIDTYATANNKPSEVQSKRTILKWHLVPEMGSLKLNEIGQRKIENYKARKLASGLSPKTVNNHLTVLRRLLSLAVEWEQLDHLPPFKWLKVQTRSSTSSTSRKPGGWSLVRTRRGGR